LNLKSKMMKNVLSLIFAVCVMVATVVSEGDVVDVTTASFDEVVGSNSLVLVEFYAPWCGHCKKLAPEYAKAAATLKTDGVVLAAVDATIEKDLAGKYGVRGYPTLKVFKNGDPQDYKGGRTEDTIVSYMRKLSGPPAKTLNTQEEIDAFIAEHKVAVVGYFKELSGEAYDALLATAADDDAVTYAVTTLDSPDVTEEPGIVLYKIFDEGKNVFLGTYDKLAIQSFVNVNRVPSIIPFSMEAAGDIFQSPIGKAAFLFINGETPDWYTKIAKDFKGAFVFATSDSSQNRLTSYVGVKDTDFPAFHILELGQQMKKYPLEGAPTDETVRAHLQAFSAGQLKPAFKSQPVPTADEGPVKVVVGKNFEDVVMDETKDVLLEVYAPWCGHCKSLEPTYTKLAEAYAGSNDVVIAKMDGTENEVDGLSIKGFPTLKFYPKGKKTVDGEDYSGGRELDDFEKFLESRGGKPIAEDDSHEEL